MSRRGRSGPAISLFAFQDIITSVTAIVLVVVLLLTLELAQSQPGEATESLDAVASQLSARIQEVQNRLKEIQISLDKGDDFVQEIAATSPAELRSEQQRREQSIADLKKELQEQEELKTRNESERRSVETATFDLAPTREENARILAEVQQLEQTLVAEEKDGRVLFTLPKGFTKPGWIAVIEPEKVSTAPMEKEFSPQVFTGAGGLFSRSAARQFVDWIKAEKRTDAYFLILLRPESAKMFDELEEMLEKESIAFGFDVITADQPVLDPVKGAAP